MADRFICYTGPQTVQIDIGKGFLVGVILTADTDVPCLAQIHDYVGAGPATGTVVFLAECCKYYPLITKFEDRLAPRFSNGAFLTLADGLYAMIWIHFPTG